MAPEPTAPEHPWFRRVVLTASWDERDVASADPEATSRTKRVIVHEEMCGSSRDLDEHISDVVTIMTTDGVTEELRNLRVSIRVDLYEDKDLWSPPLDDDRGCPSSVTCEHWWLRLMDGGRRCYLCGKREAPDA
jgi:hypothetical protein